VSFPDVRKRSLQVVKVQLSLATSDGKPSVLVYNKQRNLSWEGRPDRWLAKRLSGQPKAFFNAKWDNKTKRWEIGSQVPDPGW
jgi:hypothetical protein